MARLGNDFFHWAAIQSIKSGRSSPALLSQGPSGIGWDAGASGTARAKTLATSWATAWATAWAKSAPIAGIEACIGTILLPSTKWSDSCTSAAGVDLGRMGVGAGAGFFTGAGALGWGAGAASLPASISKDSSRLIIACLVVAFDRPAICRSVRSALSSEVVKFWYIKSCCWLH